MFRLHEKSQDLTAANAASENGLASQDSTLRSLSSKFRCWVTCICDIFTSAVSLMLMDNRFLFTASQSSLFSVSSKRHSDVIDESTANALVRILT